MNDDQYNKLLEYMHGEFANIHGEFAAIKGELAKKADATAVDEIRTELTKKAGATEMRESFKKLETTIHEQGQEILSAISERDEEVDRNLELHHGWIGQLAKSTGAHLTPEM